MNASTSASHIIFCLLVPPLATVHHVTSNTPTSHACEFIVCCVVSVTSLTMAVIAARRALALSETFRYKLGKFTLKSKLVAKLIIWITSIGIASPLTLDACLEISPFSMITYRSNDLAVEFKTTQLSNDGSKNESVACTNGRGGEVVFRSSREEPCYAYSVTIATLLIYLVCPVSLLLQGYGYRCIKQRPNQKLWEKELLLTKQHLIMTSIFCVCWTPITVLNLSTTGEYTLCGLRYAFQFIAMICALDNPVLYYIFNQNKKQEFKKWLKYVLSKVHRTL